MRCSYGTELFEQYQRAEKEKVAAGIRQLTPSDEPSESYEDYLLLKQRYIECFSNWLGHRTFCDYCKPGSCTAAQTHVYRRSDPLIAL